MNTALGFAGIRWAPFLPWWPGHCLKYPGPAAHVRPPSANHGAVPGPSQLPSLEFPRRNFPGPTRHQENLEKRCVSVHRCVAPLLQALLTLWLHLHRHHTTSSPSLCHSIIVVDDFHSLSVIHSQTKAHSLRPPIDPFPTFIPVESRVCSNGSINNQGYVSTKPTNEHSKQRDPLDHPRRSVTGQCSPKDTWIL